MHLNGLGVLQVEPTDQCNLQCKMCRPHYESWKQIHEIPKGYLNPLLWEKVVDGFVQENLAFDHIIFQWLGDPLMHPKLTHMVDYAAQKMHSLVNYLRVDSNGILLDEKRTHELVQAASYGVPVLFVFSIDAASPEIYLQVKGRQHFATVRRNIRQLLRIRRAAGAACQLNIQLQFVVQPGNALESQQFLDYWLDLLRCQGGDGHDEIMFKRLSVDGGAKGQAEADDLYYQHITAKGIRSEVIAGVSIKTWSQRPWQQDDRHHSPRTACPGLWMTPVIRHDGQLLMCCADLQSELCLGNLEHHQFAALWFGPKAMKVREEHLQGKFTGVCQDCGGINWYSLSETRVEETRQKACQY